MVKWPNLHLGVLLIIHVAVTGFLNEAIGRATERGKSVALVPSIGGLDDLETIRGLSFFRKSLGFVLIFPGSSQLSNSPFFQLILTFGDRNIG